jgi:hypothetical protein
MTKIFTDGAASHPAYINLRERVSPEAEVGRIFTEQLWDDYVPYADPNFLTEIRVDFDARFWEMYLTCALLQDRLKHGYSVSCPKPGPDILIEHQGQRIWIETITVTDGAPGKPDSVCPPVLGKVSTVPDEKIVLRYRNAIDEKHRKHQHYLSRGTVSRNDSYIIAVNGFALSYRWADGEIPRILKAVFPLGALQFFLDSETKKLTGSRHQFRPNIFKSSQAGVSTELFINGKCSGISAVMHSYANACMTRQPLGGDFLLIHNPFATKPVPQKLIRSVKEYFATPDADGYVLEHHENP